MLLEYVSKRIYCVMSPTLAFTLNSHRVPNAIDFV